MPRALVTGGAGFTGFNLSLSLLEQGHEVVIADYATSRVEGFQGEVLELDVSKPFDIAGPLDWVFHQASLTDPRYENDAEMYASNSGGFAQVVALCRRKGAKLIYASTAGLYGNGPVPMREDQPKDVVTVYGKSKLEMDEAVPLLAAELPVVGLRYFNVFGPGESRKGRPASMIYHLSQQMRRSQRPRLFEYGEQRRDHIYVKDVVAANLRAIAAPSGVYNVGTGRSTSFNQLVQILNDVMGTRLEPEYFPMPYAPASYQSHTWADTALAEEKLGFKAAWSLRDGIADYLTLLDVEAGA